MTAPQLSPKQNSASCRCITLPEALDNLAAPSLLDQLRGAAKDWATVALDASQVETASTACLQILLAASHAPAGSFRLAVASPALAAAAADLGLESHFSNWMELNEQEENCRDR